MNCVLENSTVSMLNFLSFENSTYGYFPKKYILKNLGVRYQDTSQTNNNISIYLHKKRRRLKPKWLDVNNW